MKFFAGVYRPEAKTARFLWVLVFSGITYGLYRGIQDNYLAEIVRVTAFERGIVEFFREIPGLLVVVILALLYRFSDSRVFKIGAAIMAAGMAGLLYFGAYFADGKITVVTFMVVYSIGEHIVMPIRSSISMDLARREKAGASLGISGAIGQMGHIVGFLVVSAVFYIFSRLGYGKTGIFQFRIIFAVAAVLMLLAFLVSLAMEETKTKAEKRRFYFHRKFFKFYMLEVFYGARKQIFLTFAPYVLILQYGADTSTISLLLAICAIFGFFLNPLVGKIIDKLGYKLVMVSDTLILIVVCLLYGFSHRIFPPKTAFVIVSVNFVLDSIISMASMASNVYVQRIAANQEEITATLSTGLSVNHLISIVIALMGGWIWRETGIEVLFSLSAFLGLLNSLYAATIKKSEETAPAEQDRNFP